MFSAKNLRLLAPIEILAFVLAISFLPRLAMADIGSCLKLAYKSADPKDLKRSADFALNHSQCLPHLAPPTLVPYAALSGALDLANQSGALKPVGLDFGKSYDVCTAKMNPGKLAMKQLAPILKPVCGTINMNCNAFEGAAADEVNAQIVSEVPLLSLLPCACAAATSELGVQRLAELINSAKQCGATLAEAGKLIGDAASGVYGAGYGAGKEVVKTAEEGLKAAEELGKAVISGVSGTVCTIAGYFGACDNSGPPPKAQHVVAAICKTHGGIDNMMSPKDEPNDFSMSCIDGLQCRAQPGKALQCRQGLSKQQKEKEAADKVVKDAAIRLANEKWCPARGAELKKGYDLRCRDSQCIAATFFVASSYGPECVKGTQFIPTPAEQWSTYGEKPFIVKFENMIKESIQRDAKATPLDLLASYNCRPFLGRAQESLCGDAKGFDVCKKMVDSGKIKECRLATVGTVYPPGPALLTPVPAILKNLKP
jgi:hypothetical protein